MSKFLFFIVSFISFISFSQSKDTFIQKDSIVKEIDTNTKIKIDSVMTSLKELEKDSVTVIEKPQTYTETYINEDLSLLSDDIFAKQVDELWFEAQDTSPLFIKDDFKVSTEELPELTTAILKERLAFLNSKTPFYVEYNEQLERIIKRFLKHRKGTYATLMARAKYYFPLIEEQLAKHDIPLEMKYLVVVESALNPLAKSPVGATGLWQFMYQTGQQFNLKVSSYVDERNDVLKATIAACQYLNKLYKIFKDWDLALAAYNSGPGNVSKAIRRSGGSKNYWNLRHHLPRETANYVPLFYATMYLFEYADMHQIKPKEASIQFYQTDTIQIQKQITFDQITQAIPIKKNMLKFLNPQYKLEIIPVIRGRNYTLTLPTNFIGQFVQNEDRIYQFAVADAAKREKPLPKYTEHNNRIRYKVKNGDFLGKIAKRYGVSVKKIMRWNGMKKTNLRIGQRLTIYPKRF